MDAGATRAPEPLVRGRAMIELMAHMDEFQAGLEGRVRQRVPRDSAEVLQHALPTDWIPASHTRTVIDGVVAELGSRAPALWTSLVKVRLLSSPMLRGLVEVVQRLGAMSPRRFIKAMPRGWNNAYKGWGEVSLPVLERDHAEVLFTEVSSYLFEHRQHWLAIEGVLAGLVEAGGERARISVSYEPADARVIARVEW